VGLSVPVTFQRTLAASEPFYLNQTDLRARRVEVPAHASLDGGKLRVFRAPASGPRAAVWPAGARSRVPLGRLGYR